MACKIIMTGLLVNRQLCGLPVLQGCAVFLCLSMQYVLQAYVLGNSPHPTRQGLCLGMMSNLYCISQSGT